MLYRSMDRLCPRGAPAKNLAYNASFESLDKNAPSKGGTKHLERSASKWNHQILRVSFPRKRESSVVERRSGNMNARFRGHGADPGSTKMHNALAPRRGAGDSHPIGESGDGE